MKLLIITSRFPYPLEKGDKLRIYFQIKELAKVYQIVLCSLTEKKVEEKDFEALKPYCQEIYTFRRSKWTILKNVMISFFKKMPMQVGWFFDESIKKKIHKVIQKEAPDHIYCQLLRVAEFVRDVPVPKTLDYMDAFSVIAQRWANQAPFPFKLLLQREANKVAEYEQKLFPDFDHHTIISAQDQNHLNFPQKEKIHIIPNGVDLDFFQPIENAEKKYDLVFVGNMGYRPNVEAVKYISKEILPGLIKKYPSLKILIAGARPSPEIKKLESEHLIISGWIEDIRDAYASGHIFVAPIFLGSGLQNKMLEAMAMGIPCITTTQVNNAIQAVPGESVLIANTGEEFIEKIIALKEKEELHKQLKENGLNYIGHHFSWQKFGDKLNKILAKISTA